jgi:hypothetical protein
MNGGKLLLAALVAFVAMFLVGSLWHMVVMADFYAERAPGPMREDPLLWSLALGLAVLALLMAWIYPKGYQGGSHVVEGAKFGAIIGVLWILPLQLVLHGLLEGTTLTLTFVDVPWHIVEQGIGGALIGFVYGRGTAARAAPEAGTQEQARPDAPRVDTARPGSTPGPDAGTGYPG